MFKLENVIQLREGEHIRLVAKRHFMTIFLPLFGAFLLIGIPFFFLFQIFATGPSGLVMFSLLVLAGLFWAWRTFILWDGNVLIVSTMRIVKATQTGLFSRVVTEINAIDAATNSSWAKRGLSGFLWNTGTIRLGGGPAIEAKGIPHPHEVFGLIQDLSQQARKTLHESRVLRDTRLDRINASLQSLDDTHLKQVEQILKGEAPAAHQQTFDELQVVRKEVPAVEAIESEREWQEAVEPVGATPRVALNEGQPIAKDYDEARDPYQEYPVEHHHELMPVDQDEELTRAPFQSHPVHSDYHPENPDANPVNHGL